MLIEREWFTVGEAAEYLRVSKRTIYRWLREGQLVGYRAGLRGPWRFRRRDLDGVLQKEAPGEIMALTAEEDPVLAELWDNDQDAVYDRL